jgi:hypothetical protein
MPISAHILQRAIDLYLSNAYPGGAVPPAAVPRVEAVRAVDPAAPVPENLLERDIANSLPSYALRLGQPMYPHMKIVVEPAPGGAASGYLLRVDAHDRHLHAPANSPDAAWLASVRSSNKELSERIEAAWATAGLPTFKEYLRQQLQARRSGGAPPSGT